MVAYKYGSRKIDFKVVKIEDHDRRRSRNVFQNSKNIVGCFYIKKSVIPFKNYSEDDFAKLTGLFGD